MLLELWSVILIAGLAGWLFSCIMLIFRAFPARGVFVASSGIRWGSAVLFFFFIWVVGVLNA